jgi:hypothetical protein
MEEFEFERFTQGGGRFSSKVSIRVNGSLGLSQGLLLKAAISDANWFGILHYDRKRSVIGIQLTRKKEDPGALRIMYRTNGNPSNVTASIGAKAFLEFFEIPYKEKTVAYEAIWNKEREMIIVPLESN